MAQTALELIYNWWIIEKKGLISGKDSESLSASNKLRLVLSQLNVSYSIPQGLSRLEKYANDNQDIIDGPEVIVQIRNAIVSNLLGKRCI